MYISKRIAQKKTRLHSDDTSIEDPSGQLPWIDVKAYCQKGDVYFQVRNGTIGKGCHYKNYSVKAFTDLFYSEATTWVNGFGFVNKEELEKIPKRKRNKASKMKQYTIEQDTNFTIDDIPF